MPTKKKQKKKKMMTKKKKTRKIVHVIGTRKIYYTKSIECNLHARFWTFFETERHTEMRGRKRETEASVGHKVKNLNI